MLNKINLPILVTVMCALIMLVLGLEMANRGYFNQIPKTNKTEEVTITRTDYSKAARKTLDWIDQQRNDKGWYILERGCDYETKTCDTVWDNEEGNKDGLIATWARLNFYEQTKDKKDLDIVKSDIDKFYEKYQNDNLNNSLWICKITYEMAQSKYLSDETKTKLKELCFKTEYLTGDNLSKEISDNSKMKSEIGKIEKSWSSWNGYALLLRSWDAYWNYSTDLVYRYLWENDLSYLELAKESFNEVKNKVSSEKFFSVENKCLLGLSALEIYKVDKNENEYFKYAKDLYNTLIVKATEPRKVVTPFCGLLIKDLYTLTGDQNYLKNLEFYSDILVKFNSDTEINKMISDGSFYKSDNGLVYAWYKNIVENGLIVELLRD